MANKFLFLRTENSPFVGNAADITKNSVLTHSDVDNNFIFLKGEDILTGTVSGTNLLLSKVNNDTITVDLSSISGGGGGGTDSNAVHVNESAEISGITLKSPIINNDLFLIEDSADGNRKKRTTLNDIKTFVNTGVVDDNAIHDNVTSEISVITAKTSLIAGDFFLIEDSASGNAKRRTTLDNIKTFVNAGGTDSTAIHDNISGEINGIPAKTDAMVSTDLFVIEDSAGSVFNKKKVTLANIKTFVDASGGATDNNAIHDNVPGEISVITAKPSLTGNDVFIIEDSALSNAKKSTTLTNIKTFINSGGSDGTAIHDNINSEILAITEKSSLADADIFVIEDSAGSTFNKKKVTLANLKTFVAAAGGVDTTAIHKNVHSEISVMTAKSSLVGGDFFVIEDSANGNVKRNTTLNDIKTFVIAGGLADNNAIHTNVANEISTIDEKTTLVDNDLFVIEDSADNGDKKRMKMSTIKDEIGAVGTPGVAQSIQSFPISCANIGNQSIANQTIHTKVIPTVKRVITKMSFFVTSIGTNYKIKVGIYQKGASSNTLLGYKNINAGSALSSGINTVTLNTPVTLNADTEYYFSLYDTSGSYNFLARTVPTMGFTSMLASISNAPLSDGANLANPMHVSYNSTFVMWLKAH